MFKVLVLSHGNLSKGMKNTLDLFEIRQNNCTFIQAYIDDNIPNDAIRKFIGEDDQTKIILTDLKSGSLTRVAIEEGILEMENVYLISGFNLALLIGILTQEKIDEAVIKEVIDFAKNDIELLSEYEEKEDSFFGGNDD